MSLSHSSGPSSQLPRSFFSPKAKLPTYILLYDGIGHSKCNIFIHNHFTVSIQILMYSMYNFSLFANIIISNYPKRFFPLLCVSQSIQAANTTDWVAYKQQKFISHSSEAWEFQDQGANMVVS